MKTLVIISMICLLLLLFSINLEDIMINQISAQKTNSYSQNFKLQTGTLCSYKTNQLSLFPNGTLMPHPPQCWFLPDFGKAIGNLEGTSGPGIIYGRDGLDVLQGKEGDDVLDGGNYNDILFGDDRSDGLFGSFGDDQISGGNGDDMLDGSFGNDIL